MLKTQPQKSLAIEFLDTFCILPFLQLNQEIQPYNVFLIFPEINLVEQATPARLSKIKL